MKTIIDLRSGIVFMPVRWPMRPVAVGALTEKERVTILKIVSRSIRESGRDK